MQLIHLLHTISGGKGRFAALLGFWTATALCSCLLIAVLYLWESRNGKFESGSKPYLISVIVFGIVVASWCWKKYRIAPPFRLLIAAIMAICSALMMLGVLVWAVGYGWVTIPFLLSGMTAGIIYFSVTWAIYSLVVCVWRLTNEPHWRTELIKVGKGVLGAIALSTMTIGLTFYFSGGLVQLSASNLFYLVAVPALVGFAWCTNLPRAPSKVLAIASLWGALSIGFAMIPFPFSEPITVRCRGGDEIGAEAFFGFAGGPWHWSEDLADTMVRAPSALGVLTILNILEPRPEC